LTGGTVYFPVGAVCHANVSLPAGVSLVGETGAYTDQSSGFIPSALESDDATGATPTVTITATSSKQVGTEIRNLYIRGNGTGATDQGIYIDSGTFGPWVTLDSVSIENTAQQAILQQGPNGVLHISRIWTVNDLLSRTSVTRRGVVEVHAPNLKLTSSEIGASQLSLTNSPATNCAILLDGGSFYIDSTTAEFSELGICGTANAFSGNITNSQSNFSLTNGWDFVGSGFVQISNSTSVNDGQAAANTYDGFKFDANTAGMQLSNDQVIVLGANPKVKYGVENLSTQSPGNTFSHMIVRIGTAQTSDFATGGNIGASYTTLPISVGAQAGLSGTGACATITTQTGSALAGTFKCTGVTGASTVTISPGAGAPNGWKCQGDDETTNNPLRQNGHGSTNCTISGTVTSGDVIIFSIVYGF
jgi:hypothetical protein